MKYSLDLAPRSFQHQSTRQMKKNRKRKAASLAQIRSQQVNDREGEKNILIFFVSDLYADEYAIFKIELDYFVMIK